MKNVSITILCIFIVQEVSTTALIHSVFNVAPQVPTSDAWTDIQTWLQRCSGDHVQFRDGGRGEHGVHPVHNVPDPAVATAEPLLLVVSCSS